MIRLQILNYRMLTCFKKLIDLIKEDTGNVFISATVSCGGEHKSNLGFVDLPSNFLLYDIYAIFFGYGRYVRARNECRENRMGAWEGG